MKTILQSASTLIDANADQIHDHIIHNDSGFSFYRHSIHRVDGVIVAMGRDQSARFLMVISPRESGLIAEFSGEQIGGDSIFARKCPLNSNNARVLRQYFPWTAPVSLRQHRTTIGCGDRLGLASYGHITAIKHFQAAPVLAQQSARELSMTGRTFFDVVDDATFMVFRAGYKDGYGADGNHLKTIADIDTALAAGMSMITLDLSELINTAAADWDHDAVENAFNALPKEVRAVIKSEYCGQEFLVGDLAIKIDPLTARRCAVMYQKAIDFADEAFRYIKERRSKEFDLEISINETTSPTLPAHHLFIANELRRRQVDFTSLAPRFTGDFQKAIDYIGDLAEFELQFTVHATIAAHYQYKISIHSGSDKFALYPTINRLTAGVFHLKTAGTSWLEAVRVIAEKDPVLYRVMHHCALENFTAMQKIYRVTADIGKIPEVDSLYDDQLTALMDMPEARQLLHITYGAILHNKAIRPLFFAAMHKFEKEYAAGLKKHFETHLTLLGVPPRT